MANRKVKRKRSGVSGKPLPNWNEELFLHLCKDRGYYHRNTIVYYLAKEMGIDRNRVNKMVSTGKFRWEQILFIGDYLQMTPKEFCDIFLSGYFQENPQGRFVCHLDNPKEILARPKTNDKSEAEKRDEKIKRLKSELELVE